MDNIFKIRWILSVEDEEARSIKFKWFVSTKNLIEIGKNKKKTTKKTPLISDFCCDINCMTKF